MQTSKPANQGSGKTQETRKLLTWKQRQALRVPSFAQRQALALSFRRIRRYARTTATRRNLQACFGLWGAQDVRAHFRKSLRVTLALYGATVATLDFLRYGEQLREAKKGGRK